jgi:EF-P beta-lysylation protein EpmB
MITTSPIALASERWQRELAAAWRSPMALLGQLGLADHAIARDIRDDRDFPLRVPDYFVRLMRYGDPSDPLLTQVLSRRAEAAAADGFVTDPVGDLAASHDTGLLQKYDGRALLITTGACAVHCRYCFRRHFPYAAEAARGDWGNLADRLRRLDVRELILSGGDPLMLADSRLHRLLDRLRAVPALQRLRIHTRLPVVLPSRVTESLLGPFSRLGLRCAWVIHANHPNEITSQLGGAVARLLDSGGTVLNQSVLLKSVNDDADTLETLSERLFGIGALPYYLHLLDPVAGAAHFDVPEDRAKELHRALRARLPGYLVPKLVREQAGADAKQPISGT